MPWVGKTRLTSPRQRLQRGILKKRGLEPGHAGKLQPEGIQLPRDGNKTLTMLLIELHLGLPMEVLLLQGKEADIAKRLGVNHSTVSKWRLRLGLR